MKRLLSIAILLLAWPAFAGDGVYEINQTCALVTGCFPGDGPGFPVSIVRGEPGSYRLTGNLVVQDPDTSAIVVEDSHVNLDLGGFAINGPTTCTGSGTSLVCTPAGAGNGIDARTLPVDYVHVRNGTVRGIPGNGVFLAAGSSVEDVTAVGNGETGMVVGTASSVSHSRALRNGGSGIAAGIGATVANSVADQNRFTGISGSFGPCALRENTVRANGSVGIFVSGQSTIAGNWVYENAGNGIFGSRGSTISGNTVTNNTGAGIFSNGQATVTGNTVSGNSGLGLELGGGFGADGYGQNAISDNNGGDPNPQVSGGVEIGTNVCNTNTTCP